MGDIFAEPVHTEFIIDEDHPLSVDQVRISIFGSEFLLDPDQAEDLVTDINQSLFEIEGK